MTTPRIGDTIHYTDPSGHGDCFAAITTLVLDPRFHTRRDIAHGATGHIHLVYFGGLHPATIAMNIPADPGGTMPPTESTPTPEFTPGTWHHIH